MTPGSGIGKNRIRDPRRTSRSFFRELKQFFGLKIFKFFDANPGPESFYRGIFWILFSTLLHLPPLISVCRRMPGSNPGQLQLAHWLSDALTTRLDLIHTRLDLIHNSARSHPQTRLDLIRNLFDPGSGIEKFRSRIQCFFDPLLEKGGGAGAPEEGAEGAGGAG